MPLPAGATDCHAHVFDPARFAYAHDRRYTPPPATVDDLAHMHAALGIDRVVLVQPSVYQCDNRCLLDALAQLGDRARGVAVVDPAISRMELDALHAAGVRGVRINLQVNGGDVSAALRALEQMAHALRDTPMLIQLYASLPVLLACAPLLRGLPQPVLIDHFGLASAAAGPTQPGFAELLDLLALPHVWMKLSGPYQISEGEQGYADVMPIAQAFLQAQPDRVVWGSDWPHTGGAHRPAGYRPTDVEPFRREDEPRNLQAVAGGCSPDMLERLLVRNAVRLFGF